MNKVLHLAQERGLVSFGWLDAKYSFSFGNYFNPDKMNFGALRVLNDDTIAPAMGLENTRTRTWRSSPLFSLEL